MKKENKKKDNEQITRICATVWENHLNRENQIARYMETGLTKTEAQAKADKIPKWIIKGEGFKDIGYISDQKEAKNGEMYNSIVINNVSEAFKLPPRLVQIDPLA